MRVVTATTVGRWVAPAAVALGVAALMTTSIADAGHVRPNSANRIRVSLVPASSPCTAPNREHGTPLAFPSCNPPSQTSSYLTLGSPDVNGAAAKSIGFIDLKASISTPGPPLDSDILVSAQITDVRCQAATTACGQTNAAAGPDYIGQVQADFLLRITDHYNQPSPGDATVVEISLPVTVPCTNTPDISIGGMCDVDTSMNAAIPGAIEHEDGNRGVIEFGQLRVFDGGADGDVSTGDNTLFAVGGVFIP